MSHYVIFVNINIFMLHIFVLPMFFFLSLTIHLNNSYFISGPLGQISNMLLKPEAANSKEDIGELSVQKRGLQGFYEEQAVVKEILVDNSVSVSVRHCLETAKNLLYIETDLPGDVIVHWGICKDDGKTWEIPSEPYPPETSMFKDKALRTLLQVYITRIVYVFCLQSSSLYVYFCQLSTRVFVKDSE